MHVKFCSGGVAPARSAKPGAEPQTPHARSAKPELTIIEPVDSEGAAPQAPTESFEAEPLHADLPSSPKPRDGGEAPYEPSAVLEDSLQDDYGVDPSDEEAEDPSEKASVRTVPLDEKVEARKRAIEDIKDKQYDQHPQMLRLTAQKIELAEVVLKMAHDAGHTKITRADLLLMTERELEEYQRKLQADRQARLEEGLTQSGDLAKLYIVGVSGLTNVLGKYTRRDTSAIQPILEKNHETIKTSIEGILSKHDGMLKYNTPEARLLAATLFAVTSAVATAPPLSSADTETRSEKKKVPTEAKPPETSSTETPAPSSPTPKLLTPSYVSSVDSSPPSASTIASKTGAKNVIEMLGLKPDN